MSDEDKIPTDARMPQGSPLLDILFQLVVSPEDRHRALKISMVSKPGADVDDIDEEPPCVIVPVAYWDEFVAKGAALVALGRIQLVDADRDAVGGFVVAVQGEPHEGAVAMFFDNCAYWMRLDPVPEVAELVSDDVPAPYGSIYMVHGGTARIILPKQPVIQGEYRFAPGYKAHVRDLPESVAQRDHLVVAVVNPRTTMLKTTDAEDRG